MSQIRYGTYQDIDGIVLENAALRVTVLPQWGAKIASLVYKPLTRELLWQEADAAFPKSNYGGRYGQAQSTGFDDMFPTISRCFYEGAPWAGAELPDHGEVRSVPWSYEIEAAQLRLWVSGVRLPYRLEKTLSLSNTTLRLTYTVTNLSTFALDYIWAAHPLFKAVPGMELIVPPGMDTIINAVAGPRLPGYGRRYHFPVAALDDGRRENLALVPEYNEQGYQKYYFAGPVTDGWCLLYDPQHRLNIGVAFPADRVPYLGIWVNEGGWSGQYNIAPEPATGAMDRVDAAKLWGLNSVLSAHDTHTWSLSMALQEGPKMQAMTADGHFV
jgi:galactose mutarotase-like enzyme